MAAVLLLLRSGGASWSGAAVRWVSPGCRRLAAADLRGRGRDRRMGVVAIVARSVLRSTGGRRRRSGVVGRVLKVTLRAGWCWGVRGRCDSPREGRRAGRVGDMGERVRVVVLGESAVVRWGC
ncbi:hypothetical protein GCM10009827_075690 [Dactylosporangium maewongense]|uniref:Secreted protein n=1 Tax=Dactylosporangium maewongense TaxID=634393 RepID=A0ABP4MHI9_9ACTN